MFGIGDKKNTLKQKWKALADALKAVFSEAMKRAKSNWKNAGHWLLFSVIIAVLPLALAASHDWVANYSWDNLIEKYAADFFLVTFAVAANLLGMATSVRLKPFSFGISLISAIYCLSQYSYLHNTPKSLDISRRDILLLISLACLVLNSIVGVVAELFSKMQQRT